MASMRPLSGLTTRGRSFLAAGIASVLGAVLFDYTVLLRIGLLLMVMPLVSVALVSRTRYRVSCRRALEPARVAVGQESRVHLRLANVSKLPSGTLMVEDRVPYVLGSRPRFVLNRVEPGGSRQVVYRVRSDVRGRFTLGPLSLRLADPFGLCEMSRSFSAQHALTVTPVVTALPDVVLAKVWATRGEGHATSVAVAGEDDVGTREYRHGDDMRRVHWKSTARLGELMVRREEQIWQSRATILLDGRSFAHRGEGPASSFEWAVSAAASVATHLSRHGYGVRVVTEAGPLISTAAHDAADLSESDFEGLMLDALAVVTPSRATSLQGLHGLLRQGGGDGLMVALLGELSPDEVTDLARRRQATTTAIAFLLDVRSWHVGTHDPARAAIERERLDRNATVLLAAGWRVVPVTAGARLPDLWRQAARPPEAKRRNGDMRVRP
jgi:uncharacterized protein (DUF58 family)